VDSPSGSCPTAGVAFVASGCAILMYPTEMPSFFSLGAGVDQLFEAIAPYLRLGIAHDFATQVEDLYLPESFFYEFHHLSHSAIGQ
jgi:hypothetical protein